MTIIQQVVDEWRSRRNNPQIAWNGNHPGMHIVPLINNPLGIDSGIRNGKQEEWASIKLSPNTVTDGRKWIGGGSNTACYYFSEFDDRFEVALRVGSKIATKHNVGLQHMQNFELTLKASDSNYDWKSDKTQYNTVRLLLKIYANGLENVKANLNVAFICDRMEKLIDSTQSAITKMIP